MNRCGAKIFWGVYLFQISIYNGTYRYPGFAGISNSLTDIATGNRRVICLINRCGRYLVDLKYMGLAFFIVLIHTWFDIIWRRISTSMEIWYHIFSRAFRRRTLRCHSDLLGLWTTGFQVAAAVDNQISFFEILGLVILVAKSLKSSRSFYVKESDSGVIWFVNFTM